MLTLKKQCLNDGPPPWAQKRTATPQETEPALNSAEQHPITTGGSLPPWAPDATNPGPSPTSSRKRSSLEGGLPAWAPGNEAIEESPRERLSNKKRSSLEGGLPVWAPEAGEGREQVVAARESDVVESLAGLAGGIASSAASSAPSGDKEFSPLSEALQGTTPWQSRLAECERPLSEPSVATAVPSEQQPSKGARAVTGEVVRFGKGNEVGEGEVGTTGSTAVGTQCGDVKTLVGVVAARNSRDSRIQVDLDIDIGDDVATSESRLMGVSTNIWTTGDVGEGATLDRDQGPADSEGGLADSSAGE